MSMGLFRPSEPCPHCGAPIELRSFRLPPSRCSQCGKLRDPQASRETIGCIAFLPVFVVAVAVCACAGFLAGELLAPAAGIQDLAGRLAVLCGVDGLVFALLLYWRGMGAPGPRQFLLRYPCFSYSRVWECGWECGAVMESTWLGFSYVG